jgi:hypothetical protein
VDYFAVVTAIIGLLYISRGSVVPALLLWAVTVGSTVLVVRAN